MRGTVYGCRVTTSGPPANPLPPALRWAIGLLFGEAAALAAVAAVLGYADLTATASDTGRALAVTAYVLLMAAVLAIVARQLRRRRAWPRGLAIALQLMLLVVAYYLVRGGVSWLGLPVGVAAIAVIWLLVRPDTREALGIH
jgi:hypothetical protein